MDPIVAWQDFCRRLALRHAMEFRDADLPAFPRFDDDATATHRRTADVSGCREAILSLGDDRRDIAISPIQVQVVVSHRDDHPHRCRGFRR